MILRLFWICAALALASVAVANLAELARTHPPPPIAAPGTVSDPVMRAQDRFAGARRDLRERRASGRVGYFSEIPAGRLGAEPRGNERYFSAQFALAPVILVPDGCEEWILADFERGAIAGRIPPGYRLAADLGSGVRLFRRQP